MNTSKSKSARILIFSFYIVLFDQITKLIIINILSYEVSKKIIPNLLNITLVKNRGAAFSLFSNSTSALTFISVSASLALIFIILKFPPISFWNSTGIAYLLGGTIGNGLDRLFKGYVLDFLELVPINFPIFNIADISINIAVICFLIDIIKTNNKPL